MSRNSGKDKASKTEKKSAPKVAKEDPEARLMRLGQIANIADYWRTDPPSLLFTTLYRADQYVRETAGDLKKVLEGWDSMLEKVREVRSTPKVEASMERLKRLSSMRNPWKLMNLFMSFGAIAVLLLTIVLVPNYYLIVVPVAFVFMFGLQFYGQKRLNRNMKSNVEAIEKFGGSKIQELSESCKDLVQTILSALRYELPKYGKTSDTFTLRLLSNDYSGVKLRVEEKVKKRGRRSGDLYSVVWK